MCAAWASPSEGACTTGSPNKEIIFFDSSTMSLLNLEVLEAYFFISSMSSFSLASKNFSSASNFSLFLCSFTFCFNSGGFPSNTKMGFMLRCIKLVVLVNNPTRWDVVFPLESISNVPSMLLIVVKNWYRTLYASKTMILFFKKFNSISFDVMMSLNATPILVIFS